LVVRLLNIGRDEYEMETQEFLVLWSYTRPIAYYDRRRDQHFQTDEKLSPMAEKHLAHWLRARGAVGRTLKVPQFTLEQHIDPATAKDADPARALLEK
jgi:hypothetical protein